MGAAATPAPRARPARPLRASRGPRARGTPGPARRAPRVRAEDAAQTGHLKAWRPGAARARVRFPAFQVPSAPRPATASNWTRNGREGRRARYTVPPWGQPGDGRADRARGSKLVG